MVIFHCKFTTKWSIVYIILDIILWTCLFVLKYNSNNNNNLLVQNKYINKCIYLLYKDHTLLLLQFVLFELKLSTVSKLTRNIIKQNQIIYWIMTSSLQINNKVLYSILIKRYLKIKSNENSIENLPLFSSQWYISYNICIYCISISFVIILLV